MNELLQRMNIFFNHGIHLLPEKQKKIIVSDRKYFK